ncbi:ABC transporter [Vibrio caribbeanicus]|uniref:ABC transporter n=1 Tax=Vibrio caribbeanicus TaxID=701175 RepID=A0ACC4NX21_9VIBR|nr:VacJ family lipoprotein [Vibrio caribbeanicus]KHD24966.1 ABC transporter [Vibrio caribbeanicus]
MKSFTSQIWLALIASVLLAGCASAPHTTEESELTSYESHSSDPIEGFNRAMWSINYDYLDPYLVRPVSLAYVDYVPVPVRQGVANFLSNLDEPSSMINNIVMGNGEKAVDHFNRFWINSTFGLLGLIDVASAAGITDHNEKAFSDAVGHYGVGNGPYVMVPGYGPWTVREATDVVDGMYVPLSYLNIWAGLGKWALEGMESRAALVPQESMLHNSPDPYALTRDAYLQRQDFKAEIETQQYDEEEEAYLDEYLDDF